MVEFGNLIVEVDNSAYRVLQSELGAITDCTRAPGGTGTNSLHACQVAGLAANLLWRCNDRVVELLQGCPLALYRRLSLRA